MKQRIIKWLLYALIIAGFIIEFKLTLVVCNWMGTESGAC